MVKVLGRHFHDCAVLHNLLSEQTDFLLCLGWRDLRRTVGEWLLAAFLQRLQPADTTDALSHPVTLEAGSSGPASGGERSPAATT